MKLYEFFKQFEGCDQEKDISQLNDWEKYLLCNLIEVLDSTNNENVVREWEESQGIEIVNIRFGSCGRNARKAIPNSWNCFKVKDLHSNIYGVVVNET